MGIMEQIGLIAYHMWERQGRPNGCALQHWREAEQEVIRKHAYFIWEAAGRPEGCAETHWSQAERQVCKLIREREFDRYRASFSLTASVAAVAIALLLGLAIGLAYLRLPPEEQDLWRPQSSPED
jgi:hypothetical protein